MPTALNKRWSVSTPITSQANEALSAFSPIMRQILFNRGYATDASARAFLRAETELDQNDVRSIVSMRRTGEKFCECALRCGYISSYQLNLLLARQRMLQPLIGSFFVDRKIITSHEMERIVEQFHTHNRKHWRR